MLNYESFTIIIKHIMSLFYIVYKVCGTFCRWDLFILFNKKFTYHMEFAKIYVAISAEYSERGLKYCVWISADFYFMSYYAVLLKSS